MILDVVMKYVCVSFNGGIGRGINVGYGGLGDGGFGFDSFQNFVFFEEFGIDIGGYGLVQYGIFFFGFLQGGVNLSFFFLGIFLLEVMQGVGGLFVQNMGVGIVFGFFNIVVSLGGVFYIQ